MRKEEEGGGMIDSLPPEYIGTKIHKKLSLDAVFLVA